MAEELDPPDRAIAQIAAGQHGIASIRQLHAAGLSGNAVLNRTRAGRLHRLHRGVYAVGHRSASHESRWMSARPPRVGIRLHRSRSLTPELVVERNGIPVTTPARTITDLRRVAPAWEWRRAVRQAEIRGLKLEHVETDRTRSDLERDFLRLCRRFDLPAPEVNVKVGRWTVDFLWRHERVAVETDSYDYHRGRVAFRDDHARDLDLRRRGFDVHRFSEDQVNDQPAEVAADLRDALGLAS